MDENDLACIEHFSDVVDEVLRVTPQTVRRIAIGWQEINGCTLPHLIIEADGFPYAKEVIEP